MSLSKTVEGKIWLSRFRDGDKEYASTLLNSVITIDKMEFERGILDLINDEIKNNKGVIGLFPIIEIKRGLVFKDDKSKPKFVTEDPGSEASMSHFLRAISKKHKKRIFFSPSIKLMRKIKVKKLLLVDDVVCSGNRVKEYIDNIRQNKTILSWHSGGFIEIKVISYACTRRAEKMLKNIFIDQHRIDDFKYKQSLEIGSSMWSDVERTEIKRICKDYAGLTSKPKMPFGYREMMTLFSIDNKMPNTGPAILWASSDKWFGFFQERSSIQFGKEVVKNKSNIFSLISKTLRKVDNEIIEYLVCLYKKKRNIYTISSIMSKSVNDVRKLQIECVKNNWCDNENFITKSGKLLIKKALSKLRHEEYKFEDGMYIPRNMRSPVKISRGTNLCM